MKPPALEEVRTYWILNGLNGTDVEFYDHFLANGWMVGKVPMKDWQAAARNWSRNELKYGKPPAGEVPDPSKAAKERERAMKDSDEWAEAQRNAAAEIADIRIRRKAAGLD